MAIFSYQSVTYTGTDITFSAPTGGAISDTVPATDERGFFWVENAAAGGTITVSIHIPGTIFGINTPDISVTVPDGERRLIGPLVTGVGDPSLGGGVVMSITGTMTGVTAAAVKVP